MATISGTVSLQREAVSGHLGECRHNSLEIWLDARFDNRAELAGLAGWSLSELDERGDEDLLATLWSSHRERTLQHLIGDFALAVFDPAERSLVMARDPTGQRPLHYRLRDGLCSFASMPAPLADLGPSALSLERAADFLIYVPDSASGSFFKHVDVVRPGSLVRIDADGASAEDWWRPDTRHLDLSLDEAVEEASFLLKRAIEAQLRTTRPLVAAQLSGGLDSGAVTAIAAEALRGQPTRLLAITAIPGGRADRDFPGRIVDEGERARQLARRYPWIDHRLISASPQDLFGGLPTWHAAFARPIGNYCNQQWVDRTYAEAAQAGVDVILIGLAGNYSLSFDGTMALPQLLGRGRAMQWLRLATAWRRQGGKSWRGILAESAGPYIPRPLWLALQRFRRSRGIGAIDERAFVNRDHPLVHAALQRARSAGMDADNRGERDMTAFRLFALREADPGNLNHGMRERWGIETRDPTADRRLIEFCLRLPPEHFFDGRGSRLLGRRMLAGRMDDDARLDEKKALQGADWRCSVELSRPAMLREIDAIRADPALAELFDHDGMARAIAEWPHDGWEDYGQTFDYRFKLMRTLACANWLRTAA